MLDNILRYINWTDVLVIVLVLRGGYIGFGRSLGHELLGLLGIIVAIIISFQNYSRLGEIISSRFFLSLPSSNIISFILLLLAVLIAIALITVVSKKLIKVGIISIVGSMGGLVIGLVRAGLIASLILLILTWLPIMSIREAITTRSYLGPYLIEVPPAIYDSFIKFYPQEDVLTGREIADDLSIDIEK